MTVKDALDSLKDQQRRQLMHAFEQGFPQHIELPGHRFIGVNVKRIPHLIIEQEAGLWAIGRISK